MGTLKITSIISNVLVHIPLGRRCLIFSPLLNLYRINPESYENGFRPISLHVPNDTLTISFPLFFSSLTLSRGVGTLQEAGNIAVHDSEIRGKGTQLFS